MKKPQEKRNFVNSNKIFFLLLLLPLLGISMQSICSSKTLTAKWVKQKKTLWCWAACAENSVLYERKISRHQKDAVYKLKGNIFCRYPNVTGSIKDVKKAAEYISKGTENYQYLNKKKDYYFLKRQVFNGNVPIACAGYYKGKERQGGHDVIIIGYQDEGEKITYYDPYDGRKLTCKYEDFVSGKFNKRKYDQTVYKLGW